MNITVYCGANVGNNPVFSEAAAELGKWMGNNGHTLVYGAGKFGMMGIVADAVLDNGGEAIGVTPQYFIDRDETHEGLTELFVVSNLSERRSEMMKIGNAFIALPGGMGTLDEITEIFANNRLHQFDTESGMKPAILFNVAGYYDGFLECLRQMIEKGYYRQEEYDDIIVADSVEDIAKALNQ
ncbi:MAG: TIGR00730 family Rossman fold protein [Clostridiales bacterium]|nr:TIGR00730 family Rossman fold protein [Candidatus Crickella caballi]